jgi:gliding motility-associated-like protein
LDGFGCTIELDIEIKSASSETLDLGPDQVILAGDSLFIDPILSFIPDTFYWTGDPGQLLKQDQLINWVHPETDQLFQLFAIDDKGCIYSDFLKIRVLLESSVIVPNIFSPNGDGVNDFVFPMADPSITSITFFEIFSRWGELVHAAYNFSPNDASFGWDGYFNQEKLIPAVFVYRIGAINKRGAVITKYGDITLIR